MSKEIMLIIAIVAVFCIIGSIIEIRFVWRRRNQRLHGVDGDLDKE